MNKYLVVSCMLGCVAITSAGAFPHLPQTHYHADTHSYPKYTFDYAVSDLHTGDSKTHWETRDGGSVKGSYSVSDPDGTLRIVDYTADGYNGFNAVVKKVGESLHPEPLQRPVHHEPVYKPVYEPAQEPIYKPVYEPAQEPVHKPINEPVYKPIYEPIQEPAQYPVLPSATSTASLNKRSYDQHQAKPLYTRVLYGPQLSTEYNIVHHY